MKQKYFDAVEFHTNSMNEEQLNLAYKEIDPFMDCYNKFMWYKKINKEDLIKYVQIDDKYNFNLIQKILLRINI
jgi:hypothetical protein